MPGFGGVEIFGIDLLITVNENPRDEHVAAFFGLEGRERQDGGGRGRVALVSGVLQGTGTAGLAFAETLFRSYHDGVPRVLVDTLGLSWLRMKMKRFEPQGRAYRDQDNQVCRAYRAEFESPV